MSNTSFTELLSKFVLQAHTDNLKTKGLYPDHHKGCQLKVSFGMGVKARVPWISFLANEMTTSNGYYPVYLYYKEQDTLVLAHGVSETNPANNPWSKDIIDNCKNISKVIDNPYRYGDSYAYKIYKPKKVGENIEFYSTGDEKIKTETIDNDLNNMIKQYDACINGLITDKDTNIHQGLFYLESHLEDFIVTNWNSLEFSENYKLMYNDDGQLESQQYKTDIGNIDILAKEKNSDNYTVIELKKNQTSDATIGQITRYMGWVDKHLNTNVNGIIVAGKYDEKLDYAKRVVQNIDIFLYKVQFELTRYSQ